MASKATISGADELFYGRGYNAYAANFWDRKGAVIHPITRASLGTPALGDADFLIKAATSTELPNTETVTYLASATDASPHDAAATTTTLAGVTVWDVRDGATYGRNLVSVMTHGSAVVATTIVISGYDYAGQAMSELHTITAGTTSKTVTGKKAFAYVSGVAITAAADSEANTLNIGTGAVLGLPFRLTALDDVMKASIGGTQELVNVASNATVVAGVATSPATTSTGDVRGTVTFNTALNGTLTPTLWYYVAGHSTGSGVFGVAQA
jgi:hypothetical protein